MFKANRIFPICALLAAIPVFVAGQAATPMEQHTDKNVEGAQPAAKSGQETGSPHPVQLDAQHRPITAGGFVQSGPIVFEDDSEKAGLTKWTHKMGTAAKDYIVETKGSGVGLIDYDNDGLAADAIEDSGRLGTVLRDRRLL